MSKGSRKSDRKADPAAQPVAATNPAPGNPAPATASASAGAAAPSAEGSWLESTDPRRRMIGKVVLAGLWLYVAALWLLALDQTFNWGIFGPKVPPVP